MGNRLAFVILAIALLSAASYAAAPTKEDINRAMEQPKVIWADLRNKTDDQMTQFLLLGEILTPGWSQQLDETVAESEPALEKAISDEVSMAAAIENYSGADWDAKYGTTELWRKIKGDICQAKLLQCAAIYCRAIASEKPMHDERLRDVLRRLEAMKKECAGHDLDMAEVQAVMRLSVPTEVEKAKTRQCMEQLRLTKERDSEWAVAMLEMYRLSGSRDMNLLVSLWNQVKDDESMDDRIPVAVAFAGWQAGKIEWLETTLSTGFAATDNTVRTSMVALVEKRLKTDGVGWIGAFAAEEMAEYILSDVKVHSELIEAMAAVPEYRKGFVLCALGEKLSSTAPNKAVELLIEGSKGVDMANKVAYAEHAAKLAYDIFAKDKSKCDLAKDAIAYYRQINEQNHVDSQMDYCYYLVASQCGDANDARRVLEKIAQDASGEYQKKAKYELGMIRAHEYLKAGRVAEAAKELAIGLEGRKGENADIAMDVVGAFLERAEEYEGRDGYEGLLKNCSWLAGYCGQWMDGADKNAAGVMAGEMAALMNEKGPVLDVAAKLAAADRSDEAMRCRARMLMARGEYETAGVQWGDLCRRKIVESKGDQRSWQWWRAKYYQILCWSKGADATKEELARRIAVIRSSCGPVPELWNKKLSALSYQPSASPPAADK